MGTKLRQKKKRSQTERRREAERQRKGRNGDELKKDEDTLPGSRKRRRGSQCACIACATRIDQSFANYARDFFSAVMVRPWRGHRPRREWIDRPRRKRILARILPSSNPLDHPHEGGTSGTIDRNEVKELE